MTVKTTTVLRYSKKPMTNFNKMNVKNKRESKSRQKGTNFQQTKSIHHLSYFGYQLKKRKFLFRRNHQSYTFSVV